MVVPASSVLAVLSPVLPVSATSSVSPLESVQPEASRQVRSATAEKLCICLIAPSYRVAEKVALASRAPTCHTKRMQTEQSGPRVAVIGAGVAGLSCARTLCAAGWQVTLFEASAGPGGRCATAVADGHSFDHGAQYFTVRDPELAALVAAWRRRGAVAPWQPRLWAIDGLAGHRRGAGPVEAGPERLVTVPGMASLGELLMGEVDRHNLRFLPRTTIAAVRREKFDWELFTAEGHTYIGFRFVVLALPAADAAPLLADHGKALETRANSCSFDPCWTVMLTPAQPLQLEFDAAFVNGGPLSWIADNGSKPGRPPASGWVLQAEGAWSRAHFEREPAEVADELIACFAALIDRPVVPRFVHTHRWSSAKPTPLPEPFLFDRLGIGACGDWCGGPRIEGAFVSGRALAQAVLARG
ncbi:MAG: NAD(P)-binding protein [Myxococcales bacterium]|nr:NAD(P)-binding protein [Myxococcales bacterium]